MNIPGTGDVLGKAVVEITADTQKYNRALDKAHAGLKTFSGAVPGLLKGVGVAFAGVTAAATAVTAAVTAIAVKGLREFSQFQQGAAEISTLLRGNVNETMQVLEEGVRDLSLQIPQSTALMNKALYDIISAGVAAGDSLTILGQSGRAAVAGVSEIGISAKLVTSVINALNLETKDANKIFDIAFGTVRSGVVTFQELAASVGDVLPPASKLGVSLEELFGSMAYLTKVGQSSAEASTALGRAFEALIEHAGELEGFGVNVFGSEGEFVGVLNVMRQISGVIDGLSEKERADVLEQMGLTEIRAQRAIIPMITNFREFEKVVEDVTNSAGAMETAYSRMEGTLANQWELLKNAVTELYTTVGEKFAGIATSGIQSITGLVNKVSQLLGSTTGGLGQVWADHAELVSTIFTQMAVSAVQTLGAMVEAMGKTLGQAAKNLFMESFSPELTRKSLESNLKAMGESVRAIVHADVKELVAIWERQHLEMDVTLEDFRRKQTSASEVMGKNVAEAVKKVASQYKSSYDTIEAKIDEHLTEVKAATEETSADVVSVANNTVNAVANAVKQATNIVVPALEAQKYEFMQIQDDITVITQHQEKERTKAAQQELQTREGVYREYNDKWTWFNDQRYEDWKETSDQILAIESTAQGQLGRINAKGQSEILGQQKKNATEIEANHQEFAQKSIETTQAKNEVLIGSEKTTAEILESIDENSSKRRIFIQEKHWHDYVDITADGVSATANAWADLWSIWHNTEMTADKFYSSSIGKLATWVDRVASLVNNVRTAWNSLNTVIAAIGKLMGVSGTAGTVSALAQAAPGVGAGGGLLGAITGGVKKGVGAIAGLPWGSIAGTAAGLLPAAAALGFTGYVGYDIISGLLEGTKTHGLGPQWERQGFASEEAWRQYEALVDEVNRSFEAHQAQAIAQQRELDREGRRRNEQIMLELARYSEEELMRIYETMPGLRPYITPTWDRTSKRGISGGAMTAASEINISAGVIVADEYSIREFAERLAPYLK